MLTTPLETQARITRLLSWSVIAILSLGLTACGGSGEDDNNNGNAGAGAGNNPPVCRIDTPAGDVTIATGGSVNYTATVSDPDPGNVITVQWVFPGGTPAGSAAEDPGQVAYNTAGVFQTRLSATDNSGAACTTQSRNVIVTAPGGTPQVSISSTSQDSVQPVITLLPQQPVVSGGNYSVLAINDLGMHCGDLDTE